MGSWGLPEAEVHPVSLFSKSAISGSASQPGGLMLVPGLLLVLAQRQFQLCWGAGGVILKAAFATL